MGAQSKERIAWFSVGTDTLWNKIQFSKVQNFDCMFSYVEAHKAVCHKRAGVEELTEFKMLKKRTGITTVCCQ